MHRLTHWFWQKVLTIHLNYTYSFSLHYPPWIHFSLQRKWSQIFRSPRFINLRQCYYLLAKCEGLMRCVDWGPIYHLSDWCIWERVLPRSNLFRCRLVFLWWLFEPTLFYFGLVCLWSIRTSTARSSIVTVNRIAAYFSLWNIRYRCFWGEAISRLAIVARFSPIIIHSFVSFILFLPVARPKVLCIELVKNLYIEIVIQVEEVCTTIRLSFLSMIRSIAVGC